MKKTQLKDALRNIGKHKVSFLSIIVIALLGVSVFLGLDYSACGVRQNSSAFLNAQRFRDIELLSTLLFTEEDLSDIRQTEGVTDVEAVWQVSAKAACGTDSRDVQVLSLTERMNQVQLIDGRLPETAAECAVEQKLAEEMGWKPGDEIRLTNTAGSSVQYLNGDCFIMTGIANHPDHNNTMVADISYVLVTREAFDSESLEGCCMKAEVTIEKDPDADRFSESYEAATAAVIERLEGLSLHAAARRDAGVREQFQTEIDDRQQELDEAKAELADARSELDDGWIALKEGEQELSDAQNKLAEAKEQLESGAQQLEWSQDQLAQASRELEAAKAELDEGAAALEPAKAQLDSAKFELESGWNELEDAKGKIRGGIRSAVELAVGDSSGLISWAGSMPADVDSKDATAMPFWITTDYCCDLNRSLSENINAFVYSAAISDEDLQAVYESRTGSSDGFDADETRALIAAAAASAAGAYESDYQTLQSACAQWDEGHAQYIDGLTEYQTGLALYEEGLSAYEEGLSRYESGLASYLWGLAQYNDAKAQYEQGLIDAENGRKELDENKARLEEGEREYSEALPKIADGEQQLAKAREKLKKLDPCRWLIIGVKGNLGYIQLDMASENLLSLKGTFALLFVLVGALVIFATVSKMVDEQRTQIGTTKAIGFFNREIFAKYLSFGVTATVMGTALGILTACFFMEGIVLRGYNLYYTFDLTKPAVTVPATLGALLIGAALAAAAVWAASSALLRTPVIRLMQAKIPRGARKKAGAGRKHVLSLYSRLILLNMRTDIRRVLVTVVSVAGCCALVVVGITLKSAMNGSLQKQFDGIVDYDWRVNYSPEESETAGTEIEKLLQDAGAEYTPLFFTNITYRLENIQIAELFCGDLHRIESFYHLRDWKTGEPSEPSDEGVLIQRRIAESYGVDTGSRFEITVGGTKTATVTVAGIFEHYIGRPMVVSPAYYEQLFGEACTPNCFFVRLGGADASALEEQLRAVEGFASITPADSGKTVFEASTGVINTLVALFIFMAAVMAGVVQMNLTNIYVLQKKRELTIMRINGFTVKEVIGYMLRETILTTTLGILIGLAGGSAIAYKIIRTLEQAFLQFNRDLSIPAWIIGPAMTVLFTVLVNIIALKPVKNLKLTDVN